MITTANIDCTLKSVPEVNFVHIYNLHAVTSKEDVKNFPVSFFVEALTEKLNAEHPQYSLFKITINDYNTAKAMFPECGLLEPKDIHSKITTRTLILVLNV